MKKKLLCLILTACLALCACASAVPQETKPYSQDRSVYAAMRNQFRQFSGVEFVPADHGEDYAIEWQDPTLEKLIRQALGKPEGDILHSDVWDIWHLRLSRDMETITCSLSTTPPEGELTYHNTLYTLIGLTEAECTQETGEWRLSLADLRHFDSLQVLTLCKRSMSQIHGVTADLTGLEALPGLQLLELENVKLEHQSSLSGCTGLKVLSILGEVDSLEPMQSMTQLRHLSLENSVNTLDLEPLTHLPELSYLSLDIVPVSTLAPLARMEALQYLSLSQMPVESMDSLEYLTETNITHLDLGVPGWGREQYRDQDLSPLAKMDKLVYLNLTCHSAVTIELLNEIIAQAPDLRYLEISETEAARQFNRDNSLLDVSGLIYLGNGDPI